MCIGLFFNSTIVQEVKSWLPYKCEINHEALSTILFNYLVHKGTRNILRSV